MLSLLNFTTLVAQMGAAVQAAATALLDLTVGSTLLAVLQSVASVHLWLQWLIVLVLQQTRAATSTGIYLNTWMADYGLTRLPGAYASGIVTFSRFSYSGSAVVGVGATVITGDLTQTFAVTANPANSFWNGTGYTIPGGTQSAGLPVQAVTIGTGGNVSAGAISLLGGSIPGVDTVTNALAFTNGVAPETDAAFRARFVLYINTRSLGTLTAVQYAVSNTEGVASYNVVTNYDPGGAYDPGSFYVVVDDGTGAYNATLIAQVAANVGAVAANGIRYSVIGPSLLSVPVSLSITVAAGYALSTVEALVVTAIEDYINVIPVGGTLSYTKTASVAYAASAGITNVTGLLINSGTSDIVCTTQQVVRTSSVTVT